MDKPIPPRIERFPAAKQRRMDELLDKNSRGTITPEEKARLEELVAEAERLMVDNARRLSEFAERERAGVLADAVPVTVRVQPEHAE